MNIIKYLMLSLFILTTTFPLFSNGTQEQAPAPAELPTWQELEPVNAADLKNTSLSGLLTAPIIEGTNQVFCVSYNLLAQELIKSFPSIQVIRGADQAETYVDLSVSYHDVLRKESIFVRAGRKSHEELLQLDKDLLSQFPEAKPFRSELKIDDGIYSVVYLDKKLPWNVVFQGDITVNFGDQGKSVQAFGFLDFLPDMEPFLSMAKQVVVHHIDNIQDAQEIVLSLHPKSETDEIIIGMVKTRSNLEETYKYVLQLIADSEKTYSFDGNSKLVIPKINLNIKDTIPRPGTADIIIEVEDAGISGELTGYVAVAMSLDERGATAYSRGLLEVASIGISVIIDKPFLVAFREHGSQLPYIAVWIDNDELLISR